MQRSFHYTSLGVELEAQCTNMLVHCLPCVSCAVHIQGWFVRHVPMHWLLPVLSDLLLWRY